MCPHVLLSIPLPLLVLHLLLFGLEELCVVAAVEVELLGVQVYHVGTDGVQEILVVRDDEDRRRPILK